jgi:hypothetical protein
MSQIDATPVISIISQLSEPLASGEDHVRLWEIDILPGHLFLGVAFKKPEPDVSTGIENAVEDFVKSLAALGNRTSPDDKRKKVVKRYDDEE